LTIDPIDKAQAGTKGGAVKWVNFIAGLVIGAVAVCVLGIYWLITHEKARTDNDIIFAPKVYHESEFVRGAGIVYIAGTMTGQGMAYPNNTYAITCYRDKKECVVSYVQAIGGNLIGRMDLPYVYPVTKWTAYEISRSG
jgi:hypothetical protein